MDFGISKFQKPIFKKPKTEICFRFLVLWFMVFGWIYLILDEFKNGNPHSFLSLSRTSELSSQQILARITLDNTTYPFGTILVADDYGNCRSDTRTYSNEINIQRMNVRLVDEFGTIMNLNGMDFSFCIELTHL